MLRSMLLRKRGFNVVEADGYAAAMIAASHQTIRCAIVDLRLPTEQDGMRLIGDLKRRDPSMLIFVLTGIRFPAAEREAELELADAVFSKGEAVEALLERLNQLRQDV